MLNKLSKLQETRKSNDQGFTIIEVMIVLAIAGLIMLIVFLAVPALQRNSRNTQRKNDASRISSAISEYITNHNGQAPTTYGAANGGESLAILTLASGTNSSTTIASYTSGATPPLQDNYVIYNKASCSSDGTSAEAATSSRSLVVLYGSEGNTPTQCVSAGN